MINELQKQASPLSSPIDALPTLPLDRPRSKVYSARRAIATLEVNDEVKARLSDGDASDAACTLLAAAAVVLARYAWPDPIRLGAPRCRSDGAEPLPLLVSIDRKTLLRNAVINVKESLALAEVGATFPLAATDAPVAVVVAQGDRPIADVHQDVTLSFHPDRGCLEVDYSARLFLEETVLRFLRHICLVTSALADPGATVGSVNILTVEEKALLASLNDTAHEELGATLHELFANAAIRWPETQAIIFKDSAWTYSDVEKRSNQLANVLISRGVGVGDRVGTSILPSPEQIISIIAIAKAGATVVPLDSTFPRQRLAQMVHDSGMKCLLIEQRLRERFPADVNALVLELIAPEIDRSSIDPPRIQVGVNDSLYMLYTSGSTGSPKAVVMPHRTLVNLVAWQDQESPALGKRTLNRSSVAFDVGFQEVFATLCFGGTLVIATDGERADMSSLHDVLAGRQISRIFLPPVALQQVAETVGDRGPLLRQLEWVIAAGEQLRITPQIARFFRDVPARLVNHYGPTETHVATSAVLLDSPLRWPHLPSIGRPIWNAKVYVVDEDIHHSPIGVAGEIVIGGAIPAHGYFGQPGLTAERFLPDTIDSSAGSRMYRTGDLGRVRSDGMIEFLGRSDEQVKFRGYRIELGDIESNALALPGIKQAAAKLWRGEDDEYLALYLVHENASGADPREIRQQLRELLPAHMIPSINAIVLLPALPVTTTGKLDRQALPALEREQASTAARSDIPARVAQIWSHRLRNPSLRPDDDFLDAGGHSLVAIQVVAEINDTFDVTVPLSALLRGGTLARFTETVQLLVEARHRPRSDGTSRTDDNTLHPVQLPDGRSVVAPYPPEATYLWRDIFEERSYHRHGIELLPGATVVDIGANIGLFAMYALDRIGAGHVIAVEPAALTFAALAQNTRSYGDHITCLNAGCGIMEEEQSPFTFFPYVPGMSSFHPDLVAERELLGAILANTQVSAADSRLNLDTRFEAVREFCRIRPLSSILDQCNAGSIDLLKVDVQHGEERVLQGIRGEHWPLIRQVVVEMQDYRGAVSAMIEFLQGKGFDVAVDALELHRGSLVKYIYARRG
ncbi:amino acid adenylation domain-containing protein/FkbM family methyltransferase [Bradyrhizobium sp. i1.4.4]